MTLYCADCDHVHSDTRKEAPWRWRCMKAPIMERGYRFVSPDYAPSPPYEVCSRVNDAGECPMFTPARVPAPKKEAA